MIALFGRRKRIAERLRSNYGQVKTEGFNFEEIRRYFEQKDHSSCFQVLSEQSCKDLDFDLFFCYADRTESRIGQQYLYDRLRTIDPLHDRIQEEEITIESLRRHPEESVDVRYYLQQLNGYSNYYLCDLFQKPLNASRRWHAVFPLLSVAMALCIACSFFIPSFGYLILALFPIHVLIHYGMKRKTSLFLHAVPALLSLGKVARKLSKHPVFKREDEELDHALDTLASIRRKMVFFRLDQKLDSDLEIAYWFMLEFIKIAFLLEPLLLYRTQSQIQNKSRELAKAFRFVGWCDSMVSIAALRSSLDTFCLPKFSADRKFVRFEEVRHPLLPNCIANDMQHDASLLITGSNMSGKSTFIRAIGLNYLAASGLNTCFSRSAELPVARLHTLMRVEDDLSEGNSYYFSEIQSIQQIISEIAHADSSIILLDELFKGTNTLERISAAKAVLSFLAQKQAQILVATHDIELTRFLKNSFAICHFSEQIHGKDISFDYRIHPGTSDKTNALRILEIAGFPESVVADAFETLQDLRTI